MVNEPTVMSDGKLYFFDTDGRRATTKGWKGHGKYYYYTYENGTCAINKTIDGIKLDANGRTTMTKMDMKAQDYSSNTNYLIMVDKSTSTRARRAPGSGSRASGLAHTAEALHLKARRRSWED